MSDPKVATKYVEAFVASAGAVSAVFERKARDILSKHGIEDVEDADWVDLGAFTEALAEVESEVGEMTLTEGGREMAKQNDVPTEVDTIAGALEHLDDSHQLAHTDGSVSDWGSYAVDQVDSTRYRMSCSPDYPYPHPLSKGVFEGLAREFSDGEVSLTTREIDDADLRSEEGFAVDISW